MEDSVFEESYKFIIDILFIKYHVPFIILSSLTFVWTIGRGSVWIFQLQLKLVLWGDSNVDLRPCNNFIFTSESMFVPNSEHLHNTHELLHSWKWNRWITPEHCASFPSCHKHWGKTLTKKALTFIQQISCGKAKKKKLFMWGNPTTLHRCCIVLDRGKGKSCSRFSFTCFWYFDDWKISMK